MDRRGFLGVCLGALAIPFIGTKKAKPQPIEVYGWAEHGFAVLDNSKILQCDFDYDESVDACKKAMRNTPPSGNFTDREKLKDLYISPEAIEDIRNWGVDQIDETTRKEIMLNG
jgi:hypothetical protein